MALFGAIFGDNRYSFTFCVSVLLLCFTALLFFNSDPILAPKSIGKERPQPIVKHQNPEFDNCIPCKDANSSPRNSSGGFQFNWNICKFSGAVDYIPCLDNIEAIKHLSSRRHMEHRERHCPKPPLRCLLPLPKGYRVPIPWPKSRDMIWFDNVPHSKLVEYKKDQNWVKRFGDYLAFPGGGTQFKEGVRNYIFFIEKIYPHIQWGKKTQVILDVGCGVASFGGYLLERDVMTMSLAPKDEHEAQIQFALERGIPAILSVIGTQKLNFPDSVYDVVHCARCRVHWDADGGQPLLELNRLLRPGGLFIWSATPVYRNEERDKRVWDAMVALTEAICWETVVKTSDTNGIGIVIYQKPISNSCYFTRRHAIPPICSPSDVVGIPWYTPLSSCIPLLNVSARDEIYWAEARSKRLALVKLASIPGINAADKAVESDLKYWTKVVFDIYKQHLHLNWSCIRNVMDMNAGFGGFAAALNGKTLWVMNVVSVDGLNTLPVIFYRGLVGIYHDWCEAFNTYPRTYDLLHASYLFGNTTWRCSIVDVVIEMDRILRPCGVVLVQDTWEVLQKLQEIFRSMHWKTHIHKNQFLRGIKSFWRPIK